MAPVLLMFGLTRMPASGTSLLLNAESVFTALIAWFAFRENMDRRIALGMAAIVSGALVMGWPKQAQFAELWPALAVLGACLGWAIDNNFTRRVSMSDATFIACLKGLSAGIINILLAIWMGSGAPSAAIGIEALLIGSLSYGMSLALFIVGLRHLGTARTGAYFGVAPFFGAFASVVALGEPVTLTLIVAGSLMLIGVWLHLTDEPLLHVHPHFPDTHHRHRH